jgi:hypothetical protein
MSKSYGNIAADDDEVGSNFGNNSKEDEIDVTTAQPDAASRRNYLQMAHGAVKQSYKDTKKSGVELAKEIQVECFEELEIYESLKFIKDNWWKWIYVPYFPMCHRPGWFLRYVVGPHTGNLMLMMFSDFVAGVTVALTLIPQVRNNSSFLCILF